MNAHINPATLEADLVCMWNDGLTQTEIRARIDASRRSTARRIAALREKGLLRDRPVYNSPAPAAREEDAPVHVLRDAFQERRHREQAVRAVSASFGLIFTR